MRSAILGAVVVLALVANAQAKPLAGTIRDIPSAHVHVRQAPVAHAANLPYNGGPVLHANRTHLIFWEPEGSGLTFEPGYESLVANFLVNVGADSHWPTNVYGLTGQYRDSLGPAVYESTYGGAVVASDRLPSNGCLEPPITGPGWSVCLTDSQLQAELEHVVSADRLPTGGNEIYFLLTPNGLGSCADSTSTSCALGGSLSGYCAYHSVSSKSGLLYAVIPYNAVQGHCQSDNPRPNGSTADPAISSVSHEHSEVVTDPQGNGWIDPSGQENGDLCITSFGPNLGGSGGGAWNEVIHGGRYYLQEEWSNEDSSCQPRDESDVLSFSAPAQVATNKRFLLTVSAQDPDGAIVAYRWFFGDRTTGRGRVVSHVFRRAGVYRVVLRTTNQAGNWGFYAATLRVSAGIFRRCAPTNRGCATSR